MEGVAAEGRMTMRPMDRKGALELATILIKRHGVVPETAPAAALTATNASPIFHWFGIEPPAPNETDAK
jgi:hypothetical protein